MAGPVWFQVRKALGHDQIVAGRVPGSEPLFAERYIYQDIERTVPALDLSGALVIQFGGGRVREGEPDRWRSVNLPTQSLLLPRATATHWHYSGTVDFAVFYFLDPPSRSMRSLAMLAASRGEPAPFSDVLVGQQRVVLAREIVTLATTVRETADLARELIEPRQDEDRRKAQVRKDEGA